MSSMENQTRMENKRLACAIAKENALQVTFHNETKAHEKEDDIVRNDRCVNALRELDLANEKQNTKTKTRNADYGHYLLQQIKEKEQKKHHISYSPTNTTAFCEEFVDPAEKNRLKLQKQKEFKDELDKCVKQKNDFKKKIQLEEEAEDEKRNEFLKVQESNTKRNEEQVKQKFELNEQRKNHAAMWMTEINQKTVEPTDIIDVPTVETNGTKENDSEIMNIQHNIHERKILLEQLRMKVDDSFFKSDEDRKKMKKMMQEIQEKENELQKLKN